MDRALLQQLAELRLADAEVLLAAGRWDGAYYLLGYCIECALKACVARQFRLHDVPEKKLINTFYTHQLEELLKISGLKPHFDNRAKVDRQFRLSWNTVNDWNETKRYDIGVTEAIVREMYVAVTDGTSGILPWLKTQW